jgi:tRNA(Met) cytidine acetyltransferase
MSQTKHFTEQLIPLQLALQRSFQRRMIVITGSPAWCSSHIAELIHQQRLPDSLLVSDAPDASLSTLSAQLLQTLPAIKLQQLLGQEFGTVIWDGFTSLNPDALGIASGLLRGGGLFFLLLPDFAKLISKGDPDYLRMCPDEDTLHLCHTFFLQRLVSHLQADPDILIYRQNQDPLYQQEQNSGALAADIQALIDALPVSGPPRLPTADQQQALAAIRKVAKGHRYRPLVLQADRGRGKSSVLGIAAARLVIEDQFTIAITAPDRQTCLAAFRHYRQAVESQFHSPQQIDLALSAFRFIPIDQLAAQRAQFQLIMIDEAAALPGPLLKTLLEQHPRLVFATTLQGYEGHGQGFAIRFRQVLDCLTPEWKTLSLTTPVRWHSHDPLEQWFFRFLLLNASTQRASVLTGHATATCAETHIHWLDQQQLADNQALFTSVFSLLVGAHYQTKPSDIRLILDHPHIHIAIASPSASLEAETLPLQVAGVLLVMQEGGLPAAAAADLIAGIRRPRGHLFAQAMCAITGCDEFLRQRSWRITRIAVCMDWRNKGIGTALLSAAHARANALQIDSLSTSFGLRPDLLAFWCHNDFDIVKLGLHADGASGTQSIMLMSPISESAKRLCHQAHQDFCRQFLFNLPRLHKHLEVSLCLAVLQQLQANYLSNHPEDTNRITKLKAFAFAHRAWEESLQDIHDYSLSALKHGGWEKLDETETALLILKVLQGHDHEACCQILKLKGKKDIDQRLRAILEKLLMAEAY